MTRLPLDSWAERAEAERQRRDELERRAERERQHAPAPPPATLGRWDTLGRNLYERAGLPGWPAWDALSDRERRAWACSEQFLAHEQREAANAFGALRVSLPETPAERYERHVQAVEAVLSRCLTDGGLRLSSAPHNERWLRETADAVLAAAETGI